MKVKKLLTLLAFTAMLTACGGGSNKPTPEGPDGPEGPVVETVSVESVSLDANELTLDVGDSDDLVATVSPEDATNKNVSWSSSDAEVASVANGLVTGLKVGEAIITVTTEDGNKTATCNVTVEEGEIVNPAVLIGIEVTAPTKVEYILGEEIDLAGMVVTAQYDDESEEVISQGFTTNVDELDMEELGEKVVTVTYQEMTDSFTITVNKPTDWSAAEKALFAENLLGAEVPFFFGPDFNLGLVEWDAEEGYVYGIGDEIAANKQGDLEDCVELLKLFFAAGWDVMLDGSETYQLKAQTSVVVEEELHLIDVVFGALTAQNKFSSKGTFYIELHDATDEYFTSWEESEFGPALKEAFEFTLDLPDLGNALFEKDALDDADLYIAYFGYVPVSIYNADLEAIDAMLEGLEEDQWFVFDYDEGTAAVSPDEEINLYFYINSAGVLVMEVSEQEEVDPLVEAIAPLFDVLKFEFTDEDTAFDYSSSVELEEGEDLAALLNNYANMLLEAEGSDFQQLGSVTDKGEYQYANYVSLDLGAKVTIYAISDADEEAGTVDYYIEIVIQEYHEIPELFAYIASVLGYDPDNLNYVAETQTSSAYVWAKIDIEEGTTPAEALAEYAALLLADEVLEFALVGEIQEVTLTDGTPALLGDYACDVALVEFLVSEGELQFAINYYSAAPESEWVETIQAALQLPLTWDSDAQSFGYANYISIPSGMTVIDVASSLSDVLTAIDALGLEPLTDTGNEAEYTIVLSNLEQGSVKIVASTYYGEAPVLFITVALYDQDTPAIVSAIGAAMSITFTYYEDEETSEAFYYGYNAFGFSDTLELGKYGAALMSLYIGPMLTGSESLGFVMLTEEGTYGMVGNNFYATFVNEEGWTVYITLMGDSNKNYANYFMVQVYEPAEEVPGE